ncbi:hypothetical protein R69658_01643 [Paraburkholderia aspalathi]|uniref:Uncharacterized protein n=1 Tax=Paraburkholderia aspalathi TaxID=1324617 RepID=A0ABN7L643_9BURK|nr:hypothetical protein [Paraburkholderia aspalathi]MBK3818345.1 hypothetical protein [Paraburkholderia aspalathi]MBK3830199.1 hypothetical protein [Paraburkholderia aspalathi]MBK3859363.1 hypothetical protein [Paraburkholderia aspalathi]CAE6727279.1 hypothetical protein R69658_01643 [Paraburkholderia aspalathi]
MGGIYKVGVALLFGGAITCARAGSSPTAGAQCDSWGEQTSIVTSPTLICSHGIWRDESTLKQYATVFVIRYANGDVTQPIPQLALSGTPSFSQRINRQGNAQFGYGAKLAVTEIGTDGTKARVEGVLDHWAGAQPITTHIDTMVELNKDRLIATEPDGTTYTMIVQELRN